jgi:voltage-gated potassium channel Kch
VTRAIGEPGRTGRKLPVRGHPPLPENPIFAVVLLAGLVTIVTGYFGFRHREGGGQVDDWIDHAYRAVQLLGMESDIDGEANTWLDIARVSGVVFFAAAVSWAVYALLSHQRERVLARWRGQRRSGHVVVAGLGHYGLHLALSLQKARSTDAKRRQLVAIEQDVTSSAIKRCRERGIVVLEGDARDHRTLELAGIRRASHLVLTCGEDAVNVEIARRAATLIDGNTTLHCFAHLDSRRLWPQLMAVGLEMGSRLRYRLEFFNVFDAGAHILLDSRPAFDARAEAQPGRSAHMLVVGLDGVGESVVLHAANLWQNSEPAPRERLRITVAAPDAASKRDSLVARFPQLTDIALVDAVDAAVDAPALRRGDLLSDESIDSIYVCLEREDEALAVGLALARRAPATMLPIPVVVPDDTVGITEALRSGTEGVKGIEPFGLLNRTLIPELVVRGTNETIAKAMHENYLRTQRARGQPMGEGSMLEWEPLPDTVKEQNRAFADRVGEKLRESGCAVAPNPLLDRRTIGFAFTDEEVEQLAQAEHLGWMEFAAREHRSQRPWTELSEVERDKDRDAIRALPHMLAVAGFEMLRVSGGDKRGGPRGRFEGSSRS